MATQRSDGPTSRPSERATRLGIIFLILLLASLLGFGTWYILISRFLKDAADELKFDLVVVTLGLQFLLTVLTLFPSLLVMAYRALGESSLAARLETDLRLCGIKIKDSIEAHMQEFRDQNRFTASAAPMAINVVVLEALWGLFIAPNGLGGMIQSFSAPGSNTVDLARFVAHLVDNASLVTWAFLGAYFYTVTILMRRWYLSDLTTAILWAADARFLIAAVVGLVLMGVWPEEPTSSALALARIFMAFLAGLAPDVVLSWLGDRVLAPLARGNFRKLFSSGELEIKIDGISYWQAERLSEEGIESVQNLATKDVPNLLIHTQFDTATLLDWIDQALLRNQVGDDQIMKFKESHIKTATDLFRQVGERRRNLEQVAQLLELSPEQLGNLVAALEEGPNLPYLRNYWAAISRADDTVRKPAANPHAGR